jgi:RNA polymerase sigma factor (sigma-70 family)
MGEPEAESTFHLLERVRAGDDAALESLLARYMPRLRRWARGRLPRWARDVTDTDDLVQDTLLKSFRQMQRFEHHHEGALHAYLRQAVVNRIRDELRQKARTPGRDELDDEQADAGASPLEAAIGTQAMERYESALARLRSEDREAIIARVELGLSFQELAEALDKPSADAARKAAERALVRLAEEMKKSGAA